MRPFFVKLKEGQQPLVLESFSVNVDAKLTLSLWNRDGNDKYRALTPLAFVSVNPVMSKCTDFVHARARAHADWEKYAIRIKTKGEETPFDR